VKTRICDSLAVAAGSGKDGTVNRARRRLVGPWEARQTCPLTHHVESPLCFRREFGVHFGQPSYLADGILLRTWRSGPDKDQPKLSPAVRSMIERGLVELRSGPRGARGFFTEKGVAAMRRLVGDRRLMNPQAFAHLRLELGLDEAGQAPSIAAAS
jgi:hypothetical protein